MLHYSIEVIYSLNFYLFISKEQDKSEVWISKMGMQSSWIFFSFPVMFWKDNHIYLGNQEWSIAVSSSLGHLSGNSDYLLVSSLWPSQSWVLTTQLWCQEVGNGRTRCFQVPEKLQLSPFALPHSVPWGNALGDIKSVGLTRGKLRLLDCIIQLVKIGFQRRKILFILNWQTHPDESSAKKQLWWCTHNFQLWGKTSNRRKHGALRGAKVSAMWQWKCASLKLCHLCVISNKCTTRGQETSLKY